MKTAYALVLYFLICPALPGAAQSALPQNKPSSVTPPPLPTFQIDGPGIRRPGRYQIKAGRSVPLYSVLYQAGDFINFAQESKVRIVRHKRS